jgi:hypothetical protein
VIEFAGYAERGAWPVAGGTLDQAQQFLEAVRFVWREQRHWRAEAGIPWWLMMGA